MFSGTIPFTATANMQDDCYTKSAEPLKATTKVTGIASFSAGSYTKLIGPAVPIECISPFNIPFEKQKDYPFCAGINDQCKTNPLCERYGVTSDSACCPSPNGTYLSCCAQAAGHSDCSEFPATTLLCPSQHGTFHPCCTSADQLREGFLAGKVIRSAIPTSCMFANQRVGQDGDGDSTGHGAGGSGGDEGPVDGNRCYCSNGSKKCVGGCRNKNAKCTKDSQCPSGGIDEL